MASGRVRAPGAVTPADVQAVWLSVQVASAATAVALLPGVALAWWLSRTRSRLAPTVEFLTGLPLVVPPVVTGYVLLLVLPAGIAFTWGAAVAAAAVVGFPLLVQVARVGFDAVDRELEDVARIDGAGPWGTFRRVTLPLALPGVAAGAALHAARGLGEFGATIVVAGSIPGRTQTLPLALFRRLHEVGGEGASIRLAVVAVVLAAVSFGLSRVWMAHLSGRAGRGA